jgi:hypothetical protein
MRSLKKWGILLFALIIIPIKVHAGSMLSSLSVDGIGNLNLSKSSWNLTFSSSNDYITINAVAADEGYTITGAGNVNLQEGANTIVVNVSDSKGASEDYTINVNFTKTTASKSSNGSDNPETGAFLSVGLVAVVLVISAVSLIYKKNKFYKI